MKRELLDEPTSFLHDEIEADDWLGILAGALREAGEQPIIVSGDKDLRPSAGPSLLASWCQERREARACCLGVGQRATAEDKAIEWIVDQDYSDKHFYSQVLIGDSTDNIPGCPGVGAKGAEKIVDKFNTAEPVECWQEIVGRMKKPTRRRTTFGNQKLLHCSKRELVRILRHGEYNAETRTVDLWTPPTLKS